MTEPTLQAPDVSNYDLLKTSPAPEEPRPPAQISVRWLAAAAVVAVVMVATYVIVERGRARVPTTDAKPGGADAAAIRPLGGSAAAIDVPPLDQSDPLVRELVRQLSSSPAVLAWLTSDRLIRNFTVVVSNTAEGATPTVHLRVLQPGAPFKVVDRGARLTIDPRSYQRYDAIAAAASSIDPAGAAKLYATLKPRIQEAYEELGSRGPFDRALETALVLLLKTPEVPDPIAVQPVGGTSYGFVDPRLEALEPAQKHLLRTGSANVGMVRKNLRAIALALGIPAERLPPAQN